MPFKFTLMSDVRGFLKGTADVEQALDDVADSLDDLARDTAQDADKAADTLAREFTDALDKVKTEAKTTGKKLGDDLNDGTRKAGDGVGDFKDEARQSVRETAASFSDVTDALDLVQEVAANAFVGFGPAGMAAGALAAIGIGALKASLDQAKEKADGYVESVHTMATALREVGGVADTIAESMTDIVDEKEWYEFWQKLPIDRLTLMSTVVKDLGLDYNEVFKAMSGDMEAYDRIANQSIRNVSEANLEQTTTFLNGIRAQGEGLNDAKRWNEEYANSTVAAHKRAEEAQQEARETAEEWAQSLTDHLSVAGDGLDGFVKNGKLNLQKWADEVRARVNDVKTIEGFKVDVFPELSPEAQENFAKLPAETQNQIAKAYADGSKKDRKKITTTLEAEVDVKSTIKDTKIEPVTIPTQVDTTGATTGTQTAADAAQSTANKTENTIEFKTKIDHAELQRQVNRAAASINLPTIYVNVKAKKENP